MRSARGSHRVGNPHMGIHQQRNHVGTQPPSQAPAKSMAINLR
jgi:hypothetical protein